MSEPKCLEECISTEAPAEAPEVGENPVVTEDQAPEAGQQPQYKAAAEIIRGLTNPAAAHIGKTLEKFLIEDVFESVRAYGKYARKDEKIVEAELEIVEDFILEGAHADFKSAWDTAKKNTKV